MTEATHEYTALAHDVLDGPRFHQSPARPLHDQLANRLALVHGCLLECTMKNIIQSNGESTHQLFGRSPFIKSLTADAMLAAEFGNLYPGPGLLKYRRDL